MAESERIDRRRAALIAYDVCQRALTPSDPARREAMRPVLEAWVRMIATARAAGLPVIYTTPVSRADGADVVLLPTDLSAETGVPPLTNGIEGTPEAGPGTDIVLNGDRFSYKRSIPTPDGTLVITYTGVVSGDSFTGTVDLGGFAQAPYNGVRVKR